METAGLATTTPSDPLGSWFPPSCLARELLDSGFLTGQQAERPGGIAARSDFSLRGEEHPARRRKAVTLLGRRPLSARGEPTPRASGPAPAAGAEAGASARLFSLKHL